MPAFLPPVPIDPVTFATQPTAGTPFTSMVSGPYSYGGNLYIVLFPESSGPIDAWKSTDGGQTWAALDHAGAISGLTAQACFDGIATITVVCTLPNALIEFQKVIEFDLATETWGAASADGPHGSPQLILARPDGSKIIVYQSILEIAPGTGNYLLYAVSFSGGAFGSPFQFDANIESSLTTAFYGSYENVLGCVDASGIAHVFVPTLETNPAPVEHIFYQAITASNALGSFFEFPNVGTVLQGTAVGVGIPCVQGANLVLPLYELSGGGVVLSIYIGTPLSAPSWILHSRIDPTAAVNTSGQTCLPAAAFGNSTVSIVYCLPDAVYRSGQLRLCQATNFTTWVFTSSTVFDIDADGSTDYKAGGLQFQAGPLYRPGLGIALTAVDPTLSHNPRFFLQQVGGVAGIGARYYAD